VVEKICQSAGPLAGTVRRCWHHVFAGERSFRALPSCSFILTTNRTYNIFRGAFKPEKTPTAKNFDLTCNVNLL
jgi:hypothetical protein